MKSPICLPLLASICVALAGCAQPGTARRPGNTFAINTRGSWQPPESAQPAPASAQPGPYDYSGIDTLTVDGRPMAPMDALNLLNLHNALAVGQITPVANPIRGTLRVVVPDHDRLRLLALQAHRGVAGGGVEMQAELQRLSLHQAADAVQRSRVFTSVDIVDANDTVSPDAGGADDVLWFQVQSARPNNAGPWLGSWQMRRGAGAATMAVTFDPGTPPGPPRLMSFVKSVHDVAAALAGTASAPTTLGSLRPGHPYSGGSGIVIDGKGHVLTDNHVIDGCLDVRVTGAGDAAATGARLVANDASLDLAVLQTTPHWRAHARFRPTENVRPGEAVVVTGFPLTGLVSPEMAVTTGSVTALSGGGGNTHVLQFSAPVQPGNSGGPVLDDAGRVMGVAVTVMNSFALAAVTGGIMPQNVNFATKADAAGAFLAPLRLALDESPDGGTLSPAAVGDLARGFTVKVECWR